MNKQLSNLASLSRKKWHPGHKLSTCLAEISWSCLFNLRLSGNSSRQQTILQGMQDPWTTTEPLALSSWPILDDDWGGSGETRECWLCINIQTAAPYIPSMSSNLCFLNYQWRSSTYTHTRQFPSIHRQTLIPRTGSRGQDNLAKLNNSLLTVK